MSGLTLHLTRYVFPDLWKPVMWALSSSIKGAWWKCDCSNNIWVDHPSIVMSIHLSHLIYLRKTQMAMSNLLVLSWCITNHQRHKWRCASHAFSLHGASFSSSLLLSKDFLWTFPDQAASESDPKEETESSANNKNKKKLIVSWETFELIRKIG